jgi:hypothetical protein
MYQIEDLFIVSFLIQLCPGGAWKNCLFRFILWQKFLYDMSIRCFQFTLVSPPSSSSKPLNYVKHAYHLDFDWHPSKVLFLLPNKCENSINISTCINPKSNSKRKLAHFFWWVNVRGKFFFCGGGGGGWGQGGEFSSSRDWTTNLLLNTPSVFQPISLGYTFRIYMVSYDECLLSNCYVKLFTQILPLTMLF